MKKKIVIKVAMCNREKSRSRALKIAATAPGVESVALTGAEMDELEITGESIDTIELTRLLRKKVGCADLMSVGPVIAAQLNPIHGAMEQSTMFCPTTQPCQPYYCGGVPAYPVNDMTEPPCSIM